MVLLVALSMGACASSEAPFEPSAETTEAISALEVRLADLEADLQVERDDRGKLSDRLDALSDKLERSLDRLTESMAEARSGSAEARESAASALATVRSVASDLSVLEERYEYHLRRYHGGGG